MLPTHVKLPEGEISGTIGPSSHSLSTLDEPVSATIWRDLGLVGTKLMVVLVPRNKSEETLRALRDWDLWGPLMVCLTLSIMLSLTAPADQAAMVFTGVFMVVWVGAAVVTINAQLLGSSIICVLGYCVFPLNIATLSCLVIGLVFRHVLVRIAIVTVGFLWSTRASVVFMSQLVSPKRKLLAIYPVLLFYVFLSWMILIQ